MKKLLAIGLAGSMFAAAAASAGTIQLSLKYLGSTPNSIGTLGQPNAANPPTKPSFGLTTMDFTQPASHDSTLKHWFEVDLGFTPTSGATGEDFQQIAFDINTPSNLNKIDKGGNTALVSKWYPDNPTDGASSNQVYSSNGDAGTAGDLLAISAQQSSSLNAALSQTGEPGSDQPVPTPVGWFVVQTTNTAAATINLTETFGNNVGYFINNDAGTGTPVSTALGFSSTPFTIVAAGTAPEPASLSALALGALACVRRRRA